MFKNYLKIAIRYILKYKVYSFINVTGLTIGIACCLLILLYVQAEFSYDRFHKNADRIYRVAIHESTSTSDTDYPVTPGALAAALVNDYPEVLHATRLSFRSSLPISYGDKLFDEPRIHRADANFFDVFQLPFIQGDPKTALRNPSSVVISKSMAQKYFGEEEPIGKILDFKDGITYSTPYTVTGVIEDIPDNAHFHVDFLISWLRVGDQPRTYRNWGAYSFYTYILLAKNQQPKALEAKFPEMVRRYLAPQIEAGMNTSFDEHLAAGNGYRYFLQPLIDIHLHSNMGWEIEPNGNIKYVYVFAIMALFILVIACINYMNLATSRSADRSKEIGIRKVLGSERGQLIVQLLAESVLLAVVALFGAILLVELLLPAFNTFANKQLSIDYFGNLFVLPVLLGFTLVIGLLAGMYPAFFLSTFRPIVVLRGRFQKGMSNVALRNGLVVFQFVISIALIVGTIVIHQQMSYMQSKNLGFNKEHVVVIEEAWALGRQREAFKQELLANFNVVSVSVAENLPGHSYDDRFLYPENAAPGEQYNFSLLVADHDYVETLALEMAQGRTFSRVLATDSNAVLVNEAAVKILGLNDPIGKGVGISSDDIFPIIGVIKDFHFKSLHDEINPLVYFLGRGTMSFTAVRIRSDDISSTLDYLKARWFEFVPDVPFKYSFLDEDFAALYRTEQKTQQLFSVFSVLAIMIASIGLFGLAAFTAERRTKEIGVRKVLGASISNLLFLLNREFFRLVVIANVIAWPIAYYSMTKWLQDFAYRIDIGWWVFALAGGLALLIALLTVSTQAIRAALANPVKSLRYE